MCAGLGQFGLLSVAPFGAAAGLGGGSQSHSKFNPIPHTANLLRRNTMQSFIIICPERPRSTPVRVSCSACPSLADFSSHVAVIDVTFISANRLRAVCSPRPRGRVPSGMGLAPSPRSPRDTGATFSRRALLDSLIALQLLHSSQGTRLHALGCTRHGSCLPRRSQPAATCSGPGQGRGGRGPSHGEAVRTTTRSP